MVAERRVVHDPADGTLATNLSFKTTSIKPALAPTGPPLVEARGLTFGFAPAAPVVVGVDLHVHPGDRVALVGPNGAGKTTLLRLLAGTLAPQAGSVMWEGRSLRTLGRRALARLVAVVPQNVPGGPLEDMTVEEVAALGRIPHAGWLGLRGETIADREAIVAALAAVDALSLVSRPLRELSGGERHRALLAMALAQQPRLLLLDEPTRHLDPHHQVALLDLLVRMAGRRETNEVQSAKCKVQSGGIDGAGANCGLGAVAVLHDLNLAAWYFPRLVLLQDGRVVADGPPASVLTAGNVERAYGPGLEVFPHPRRPDVPLVLPKESPYP